jgi:hypothetical protein
VGSEVEMMKVIPMTRKERQMPEDEAKQFLQSSNVGRLGINDSGPYVIPFLYFYDPKKGEIYLHCAKKGRKNEALKANSDVCFEVDEMKNIVEGDKPCEYDLIFRSVVVFGQASFVNEPQSKADLLNLIFTKYSGKSGQNIDAKTAEGTQIIKIKIASLTGKEGKGVVIPYP